MELKPGYKQTEVGVIPEDWDALELEAVCTMKSGEGITASSIDDFSEYPCYGGNGLSGYTTRFTHDGRFALIGRQGALCGNVVSAQGKFFASEHAVVVTPRAGYDIDYLTYVLGEMHLNRYSESSAQPGLSVSKLLKLPLAAPRSEAEQRSIAMALRNVDALLGELGNLIAKRRGIKQAAMQELLTGKRRLPGFEGEWEVKRLGSEIRHLQAGVSVTSTTDNDQANTDHYVLKTSAVFQGRFMPALKKQISPGEVKRAKTSIRKGDLIISRMNTPALVGECGYSDSDYPNLFLPDRLWRADCRDPRAVSSRWLTYALSMQQNRLRIKDLATGTSGSMKNISKYSLLDLEIEWPSFTEQIALATVLSEMDNEIDLINEQLQKANSIKQGMMQQLLTGKIRLR